MALPRTRSEIDALPYRLQYGHWGLTASKMENGVIRILATANFPVGVCGPFDPPEIQDRVFDVLDRQARLALAAA